MDHISKLLPKTLRKHGLLDEAKASLAVFHAKQWLKVNLPSFMEEIRPTKCKDKTLFIEVEHSTAAQECQFVTSDLLLHLHDKCGLSEEVESIRILRA
ncbi:DUF721 domain-containing protein [Patescibacteria group bacterium]|nr:DUF721 domain-containing protein [Patescibacteria group bacterium]MBU2260108.1 DUF721 domain-containing protein [Patescibacteria group bacterium]